jgi:mono/diheme cytochrome c family protein
MASCGKKGQKSEMNPALAALAPDDRQRLLEGRTLYHLRGCAGCHGLAGHGNGDRAAQLLPPPMDFRLTNAYLQGTDLESMATTVKKGLTNVKTAMPAYPFLSDEERRALARYIIHMRENYK